MNDKLKTLVQEIVNVDNSWKSYYDKLEANGYIESDDDMVARLTAEGYSDGLKTAYEIISGTPYQD